MALIHIAVMLICGLQHPEYEHNRCFLVLQLQTHRLCLLSKAAAFLFDKNYTQYNSINRTVVINRGEVFFKVSR